MKNGKVLGGLFIIGCMVFVGGCSGEGCAIPGIGGSGVECSDMECFSEQVSSCKSAILKAEIPGAAVRYKVVESVDEGCRIELTYLENPNADWVDKALTFVVDPEEEFEGQLEDALSTCLTGRQGDYHCAGPLFVEVGGSSGDGQMASGNPCGQDVADDGEPLYAMSNGEKWGYVDADGDWVIEPQWWRVRDFSEGRAIVKGQRVKEVNGVMQFGAWGGIDRQGDYVLEPSVGSSSVTGHGDVKFGSPGVSDFSQGCAAVDGSEWGNSPYFLTRDGESWKVDDLLPEDLDYQEIVGLGPFSEGLAWIELQLPNDDPDDFFEWMQRFGWIDHEGDLVIEPKFEGGGDFTDGLAPASMSGRFPKSYINKQGDKLFGRLGFYRIRNFSEGWAPVVGGPLGGAFDYGFISLEGQVMDLSALEGDGEQQLRIAGTGNFREGLAPVLLREQETGTQRLVYINGDGAPTFVPEDVVGVPVCNSSELPEFHQGLVRLLVAREDGLCDPNEVFKAEFPHYESARYLYLDRSGQVVLEGP